MSSHAENYSNYSKNNLFLTPKATHITNFNKFQRKTPQNVYNNFTFHYPNNQEDIQYFKKPNPISDNLLTVKKQQLKQENPTQMSTAKSMIFLNTKFGKTENSTKNFSKLNDMAKQAHKNFDDLHIGNQKKVFNLEQYYQNKKKGQAETNFLKIASRNKNSTDINNNKKHQKQFLLRSPKQQLIKQSKQSNKINELLNKDKIGVAQKYSHQNPLKQQFHNDHTKNYTHVFHEHSNPQLHHFKDQQNFHDDFKVNSPNNKLFFDNSRPELTANKFNSHIKNNQIMNKHYYSPTDNNFQLNFKEKQKKTIEKNKIAQKFQKQNSINSLKMNQNSQIAFFKKPKTNLSILPNNNEQKKMEQQTAANTPVKDNLLISPEYFAMKLKKYQSQVDVSNTQQNKINEYISRNNVYPEIKSTMSDDGSNSQNDQSFQYMNDFEENTKKNWTLDDFQIKQKLGKGAFGQIFVARQIHIGFFCVLKKMSKKKIKQSKLQQHIIRQIKIQSFLNHKHLTALYGFFSDKDYIYLILQYLTDGSLAQLKRKRKTSQQQTVKIVRQVCEGLKYMHHYNILHRDIKPENIFVHENYMKIGDFGCAVMSNALRNTIVGCLDYSSPQQLNNGFYNQKIDVWGVGILVFELLTGKSPFQSDIVQMVRSQKQVNFSQIKFPQNVPISHLAKDFILKLLTLDPDQRLSIDEALDHQFMKINETSSNDSEVKCF